MKEFMKNYQGKHLYYFVANGEFDSPERIVAGDDYEKMYNTIQNKKISFAKKLYAEGHVSMVPASIFDGLQFIFKDYNNLKMYPTFALYRDNYRKDMKENYGLEAEYKLEAMDNILMDISLNKKKDDLAELLKFVEKHKLWQNPVMKEPGGLDAVNIANFYDMMGESDKTIQYYNIAFKELNKTVEPAVYFGNIMKPVQAYIKKNNAKEGIELLIKSRDYLMNNKKVLQQDYEITVLLLQHSIAKLSSEHKVVRKEGKKALAYCKKNYKKNQRFSLEDLEKL